MDRRLRAAALLAILAVLLGGIAVLLWRGDPVPAELMAPLGVITAFLVWAEKEGAKPEKEKAPADQGRAVEKQAEQPTPAEKWRAAGDGGGDT